MTDAQTIVDLVTTLANPALTTAERRDIKNQLTSDYAPLNLGEVLALVAVLIGDSTHSCVTARLRQTTGDSRHEHYKLDHPAFGVSPET